MSSMYLDSALRGLIDPLTGLPKKKQDQQSQSSLNNDAFMRAANAGPAAYNPSSLGPVGGGAPGTPGLPAAPDYKALINDLLKPLRDELGAQGIADTSQLTAATQRALTLFGQVPDFQGNAPAGLNLDLLNQAVTPEVRQMAQQNTEAGLSIAARQAKAFQDQVRQIRNALAARGALRSGEAGHQLQNAQLGRDQASFDTTNELMEFIAGLQAGLAERERARQAQLAGASGDAEARVRELYPAQAGMSSPNISGALPPGWISGANAPAPTGSLLGPGPGYVAPKLPAGSQTGAFASKPIITDQFYAS